MIDNKDFELVWAKMPQGWAGNSKAGDTITPPTHMPYFVSGAMLAAFRAGRPVDFDHRMLMRGCLHEWLTPAERWGAADRHQLWAFLKPMLTKYAFAQGHGGLSAYLVYESATLREQYGPLVAIKVLMAAHALQSKDAQIRCDLLLDIWAVTETNPDIDRPSAFGLIRYLYDGIDFDRLDDDVIDELDYANFVALSHLGDYQRRNWLFWRVISKRGPSQRPEASDDCVACQQDRTTRQRADTTEPAGELGRTVHPGSGR